MERVGYVYSTIENSYIKEQIDAIRDFGVKKIIIEEEDINTLKKGDELIIYELKCLGRTIIQLANLLSLFRKKKITLTVIKKDEFFEKCSSEVYFNIISDLAELERFVIGQRTTRGIQMARRSGRVGGRPKISEDKIKEIRYLYHNQSYTLREIVEKCGVSLGTAYKYIQNHE